MLCYSMDNLVPVEVVGNILSRLGSAKDAIIASTTCRKWREAFRKHLHTLSFTSSDFPVYRDLTTANLQIIITQTIFQTSGLQGLLILMDDVDDFSASTVMAWLMYTRETLRTLSYNVSTTPTISILDICARQKLEMLVLAHNSVTGVEPTYQIFPCLNYLSFSFVTISALDLNLLLWACPKIQTLELINPYIAMSDSHGTLDLASPTLKRIYVEAINLDKFILEAYNLEYLHLKDCSLELFELVGKGALKEIKIDDVSVIHLDIGENIQSLQTVDISNFTIIWSKFFPIISTSSMLRKLRLWDVVFEYGDETFDLETIAVCFPHLTHLSLSYDLGDGVLQCGMQGYSLLENVILLEIGWTVINDLFSVLVEVLLKRCSNLKKLVIHGVVSDAKTHEDCNILANFTSSMVSLMRQFIHVEVEFEYE